MKRLLAVLLVFIMVISPFQGLQIYGDVLKPNNSFENAKELELNQAYTITEHNTTGDYFVFTTRKTGMVNFEFQRTGITGSYVINFNAVKGNGLIPFTTLYTTTVSNNQVANGCDVGLEAGTYYVIITRTPSALDDYKLKITFQENANCETEKNATIDTADTIKVNTALDASIYSTDDVDYYRYTATETGPMSVKLTHPTISGNDNELVYTIKIYSSDAPNTYLYSRTIQINKLEDTTTALGVTKGKNYYISVAGTATSVGYRYKVQVNQTKSDYWEQERNESGDMATEIQVNKKYSGVIAKMSDEDYFKFTAPDTGHFNVNLSHENAIVGYENSNTYKLYVYADKAASELVTMVDAIKGGTLSVSTAEISVKKGATYYIRVTGNGYCSDTIYNLKVNYEASDAWELESNDSYATATVIKSGKTYYGCTSTGSDKDYYKINMPKKGYMELKLVQKANIKGNIYKLSIIDSTYEEVYSTYLEGLHSTFNMAKLGLKKGSYYILITSASEANLFTGTYKLKATAVASSSWETEDNNDFTTANKIKVQATVHGSTLTNVRGTSTTDPYDYYKFTLDKGAYVNLSMIHDKINGSDTMWYVCLYDGNAKTVKNSGMYVKEASKYTESQVIYLKKGAYYVRISASDAGAGHEYALTVNRISAKKPTIKKLSLSKGKVKLSWEVVPGAKKYIIYRSTSQSGAYKKVKEISSVAISSWTDKTVKKGKTYFYKMRVVVVAKTKRTSGYSNVKKIKIKIK